MDVNPIEQAHRYKVSQDHLTSRMVRDSLQGQNTYYRVDEIFGALDNVQE